MRSPGFTFAVVFLVLSPCWVQAQSASTSDSIRKNTATTSAVSPVPPQEVAPPPPPEQKPPQPPTVAWDGKQLTIDAENSTLADILLAVRKRTNASIEIPGAASSERVFVHLGPGPARDIISSLLYGTSFDYVIEAADDDPDTLRSVVLTVRGIGDTSSDVAVAGAANPDVGGGGGGSAPAAVAQGGEATDGRTRPGARMMRGWASPGKTTVQADAEAALAAQQAAKEQESAAAQDPAATQESAAAQDPATAQESRPAQDSAAAQESRPAQDSAAAEDSAAAVHAAEDTKASNSSPSTSDSNDQSGVGQAIQNMTRMFEQRRQLQSQQNQPPPPSSN